MKNLLIILILTTIFSCAAKKHNQTATSVELLSGCSKNGTCTIKLMKNKRMLVTQDEFGSTQYSTEPNAEKDIIVFNYSKTVKGNLQDASYREEIIFEIGNNLSEFNLSDAALQNTKMLFGRFCYCKGQTGYYKVNKGKLSVTEDSKHNIITVDFVISEVPQVIQQISFSIK